MKRILFLLIACSAISMFAARENVPIDERSKKTHNPHRPRVPARINVEAWIEDNLLSILFHNPEGDAIVSLYNAEGYEFMESSFTTEAPIIIDLSAYGEVSSFTIETDTGKTYIGYL